MNKRITLYLILSLCVIFPSGAHAILPADAKSLIDDSILYIRDDADIPATCNTGSSAGSLGTTNERTPAAKEAREQAIWTYLTTHTAYGVGPLEPYIAAGIMGNMQTESANTFNPTIVQGGTYSDTPKSSGYGIVQWTPGTKIIRPISILNGQVNDLGSQLDLLWAQLFAREADFQGQDFGLFETNAGIKLLETTDVPTATEAFRQYFERNRDGFQQARVDNANAILAKYGSSTPAGAVGTSPQSAACGPGTLPGIAAPGTKCQVPAPGSLSGAEAPPDDYARITNFRGGTQTLNQRTVTMLENAESYSKAKGGPAKFTVTQGSYTSGVSASAETHDGGGALDISVRGMTAATRDIVVWALRLAGFAAWNRHQPTFSEHIHAIAIGDREMSTGSLGAEPQVRDYFNGGDGLSGNGPDPDAGVGRPYPDWAGAFCTP